MRAIHRPSFRPMIHLVVLGIALAALPCAADNYSLPAGAPASWQRECAACHIAYPPQMLAAPAWQRLMQNLDKHFATDASLAPADVASLSGWLQQYAAPPGGANDAASNRISDTAWFQRKHHEIPLHDFRLREIRSPANCQACHARASQGSFRHRELTSLGARFDD